MTAGSTGNCYLCGAALGKVAMKNHLLKHSGEESGGEECRLVKVEGLYDKNYWIYFDIPCRETLELVDIFLRDIWLECCGHMSAFFGPGKYEIDMNEKINSFPVGEKISHQYDFGSTTETVITVMGTVRRKKQKDEVRLLARNIPFAYKCADCGKPAVLVTRAYNEPSGFLFYCEDCGEAQEDGFLLPVTNSPRMGECGYGGENDCYEFQPDTAQKK